MRIAIFTNDFPAKVSTFIARDIASLKRQGISIDIFAFYPYTPENWNYVPKILSRESFNEENVFHLKLLSISTIFYFLISFLRRPKLIIKECHVISKSAINYGFLQFLKTLYVLIKAVAWTEKTNFKEYNHLMAYWGNYAGTLSYLIHKLSSFQSTTSIFLHAGTDLYRDQIFMEQKLNYADVIFTESEFNKQFILNNYPGLKDSSKISIHYNGIDVENFPFDLKRPDFKVLAVGGLNKYKGYDYLLKAVSMLKKKGIPLHVEIVGEGPEKKHLDDIAKNTEIETIYTLTKWLPFEEVKRKMSVATIFVHPSAGDGDCTPNVLKEAMAVGTPVIASQVTGVPEVLNHGNAGILVPTKEVNMLAEKMEMMLGDLEQREKFALNGRQWIEKEFNMWKNGEAMANIIKNLNGKNV